MMTRPVRRRGLAVLVAGLVLVAACGGGGGDADDNAESDDTPRRQVLLEPASAVGPAPFTDSVAGTTEAVASAPTDGVIQRANAPGLYGGTGNQNVCDQAQLTTFLEENPDKAAAWADAQRIEPDEIGAYVESLTPAVLQHDTQVTNHGFADGVATPRQSVLQAGTAVLIDDAGVPRTRCACGNPLLEPAPVADQVYEGDTWEGWEPPPVAIVPPPPGKPVPGVPEDPVVPVVTDFCTVYEEGRSLVEGGPSGPADVMPYLARLEVFFSDLIAAADATEGFPEDALTDMQTFHSAIVDVIDSGDPSTFEGSTELRDQLEAFLEEYCANPPDTDSEPPFQDPLPDGPVPNAQCGSFMFYLLADAAELLGVDWMPVAQPFIDEMEAIAETTELSDMLDLEEVGCEGAQALYDLLVDAGFGDVLDGSDLDPYA